MIATWLASKLGIFPLTERVSALEHRLLANEREIAERSAANAALMERAAAAEANAALAIAALERLDRGLRVMTRAARAGSGRLQMLEAANRLHATATQELEKHCDRQALALEVLDARLDDETEQARRSVTTLFHRMETMQLRMQVEPGDRMGPAALR